MRCLRFPRSFRDQIISEIALELSETASGCEQKDPSFRKKWASPHFTPLLEFIADKVTHPTDAGLVADTATCRLTRSYLRKGEAVALGRIINQIRHRFPKVVFEGASSGLTQSTPNNILSFDACLKRNPLGWHHAGAELGNEEEKKMEQDPFISDLALQLAEYAEDSSFDIGGRGEYQRLHGSYAVAEGDPLVSPHMTPVLTFIADRMSTRTQANNVLRAVRGRLYALGSLGYKKQETPQEYRGLIETIKKSVPLILSQKDSLAIRDISSGRMNPTLDSYRNLIRTVRAVADNVYRIAEDLNDKAAMPILDCLYDVAGHVDKYAAARLGSIRPIIFPKRPMGSQAVQLALVQLES